MANEWSKVRTYLEARINDVDSDFREHKDGFNVDNVPRSLYNKTFHLLPVGVSSAPQSDNVIIDENLWEMRLFFKGFRDPQEAMDTAMDTAYNIRFEAAKPENAKQSDVNIKDVWLVNAVPTFPDSNDNAIIVVMTFNVTMLFSGCE